MKLVKVKIEGVTPLIQHRFSEENEADVGKGTRRIHIQNVDPRKEAEKHAHKDKEGRFYFPGQAVAWLIREMGASLKQKGSRRSIKYIIPSCVFVVEDIIPIIDPENNQPVKSFEVDGRPVTIPATKGRIMRYRPRYNKWAAEFHLRINDALISEEIVQQLLTDGGMMNGLGDFRPQKGGPFGTFRITTWEDNGKRGAQ